MVVKLLVRKTSAIMMMFWLGFLNSTLGQVLNENLDQTPQELYNFHIQKKKSNLTAALVTLGGGAVLIAGGISTNINNCLFSGCNDGMPLVYSGVGLGLSSIVFFEMAGKHKKKAKIQLQNGAVGSLKNIKYSGVSIVYSF